MDSFLWLKPSSHSNFENAVSKRTDIRDHVHVPGLGELSLRDRSLRLFFGFGEPCLKSFNLRTVLILGLSERPFKSGFDRLAFPVKSFQLTINFLVPNLLLSD